MDTQIVYVSVSSADDLFLEQLWASAYSLRRFHPEATVMVLTDGPTAMRINSDTYQAMRDLITEVKVVEVNNAYSGMQRSREIKTSIRNLIDGDFLYIDTDTIITAPIDGLDRLKVKNLAMVPNMHRHSLADNGLYLTRWTTKVKKVFNTDINDAPVLFNGGAFFVHDNAFTREFFTKWHENWLVSVSKGLDTDQQALVYTDKNFGYVIEKMPDIYNCQVLFGVKYFFDAKILHIYHIPSYYSCDPLRVLWSVYDNIRKEGCLSEETKDILKNPKSHLSFSSCLVSFEDTDFMRGRFFNNIYRRSRVIRWCINKFDTWAEGKAARTMIQ